MAGGRGGNTAAQGPGYEMMFLLQPYDAPATDWRRWTGGQQKARTRGSAPGTNDEGEGPVAQYFMFCDQ